LRWLAVAVVLAGVCAPAAAVENDVDLLLDLDNNSATGCTVATVAGSFEGVEQKLISRITASSPPDAGTVTDTALSDCVDPATGAFGAPSSFDGGWPVGIDNGTAGRDLVETYAPLAALVVPDPSVVRLGVVVTDELGGAQALLTTNGTPGGGPILLDLSASAPPPVTPPSAALPTLGQWALVLLACLLAGASLFLLRRHPGAALALALLVLGTGVAWAAIVLDGQPGDWSAGEQLASDGMTVFGTGEADRIVLRVDADLLFGQPNPPPDAVDDSFSGIAGNSADNPLDVLANDTDPADSFTITAVGATSNGGVVAIVGAGSSLTYTPAAGFAGTETFTYTITDSAEGTDSANVSVTVDGIDHAPVIVTPATVSVPENQTAVIDIQSTDVDGDTEGAGLSYALTGGADQATFALDPDSGVLSFAAAPNFEAPGDADRDNVYAVRVSVTDSTELTDTQDLEVSVTNIDEPPQVVSYTADNLPLYLVPDAITDATIPVADIGAGAPVKVAVTLRYSPFLNGVSTVGATLQAPDGDSLELFPTGLCGGGTADALGPYAFKDDPVPDQTWPNYPCPAPGTIAAGETKPYEYPAHTFANSFAGDATGVWRLRFQTLVNTDDTNVDMAELILTYDP
jgi:hypothetical protein